MDGSGTVDLLRVDTDGSQPGRHWSPMVQCPGLLRAQENGIGYRVVMHYQPAAQLAAADAAAGVPWSSTPPAPAPVLVGAVESDGSPGDVPHYEKWMAHSDASAEAFTHWNEDGEIPATYAGCHSPADFRDLLGADGSEPGVINQAHAPGGVIDCAACHNDAAAALDRVTFPSPS